MLSVNDLQDAEKAIINFCQSTEYKDELASLRKGTPVKETSPIHKLTLVLHN